MLDTPERGRQSVRWLAGHGADDVKTFINLTPPVLEAIRSEAAEQGLPVIGHVPRFSTLENAGVMDVQHLTGIPEGPTTAFAVDGSFPVWLEAWRDAGTERHAQVAEISLEQGIAHTATLVLWKGLAAQIRRSSARRPRVCCQTHSPKSSGTRDVRRDPM